MKYEQPHESMEMEKPASFQEKLMRFLKEQMPGEFTFETLQEDRKEVEVIEHGVQNMELAEFLKEYGVKDTVIELDRTIAPWDLDWEKGEEQEKVYKLEVKNHFSQERIPEGYAYSGGAARALLLRSLGIDPTYLPRDIDVVRMVEKESYPGQDDEVAKKWMPDDYSHGFGVRDETSPSSYFITRDLTINEVIATDDHVLATESCLKDTVRRIIRLTQFQEGFIESETKQAHKLLGRLIRFYVEAIERWGEATIEGVDGWQIEKRSIRPFYLALQLERAYEVNKSTGDALFDLLKVTNRFPAHVKTIEDATLFLSTSLSQGTSFFRHAPVEQFELEEEWFEDELSQLPHFQARRYIKKN